MRFPCCIFKVFTTLCGRLGRVCSIAASIVRDAEAAEATAQEGERVRGGLLTSVHTAAVGEGRVVLSSREGGLGTAVETTRVHASVVAVGRAHSGVGRSSSTKTGGESVGGLRTAVALTREVTGGVEATLLRSIRGGSRSAGHGWRSHSEALGAILLEVGIGDQSSACTRSTTTKTANVLSKVVVVAALGATSPVSGTERNVGGTTAAHTTTATHVVVTHVVSRRTHHTRVAVTVAVHRIRSGRHGREAASEAGSAALEVGEAARRAGPVTGTGTVLAGREGSQDVGGAVENTRRGRRDLDGLLVKCTSVHAEGLSGLVYVSLLCQV